MQFEFMSRKGGQRFILRIQKKKNQNKRSCTRVFSTWKKPLDKSPNKVSENNKKK